MFVMNQNLTLRMNNNLSGQCSTWHAIFGTNMLLFDQKKTFNVLCVQFKISFCLEPIGFMKQINDNLHDQSP